MPIRSCAFAVVPVVVAVLGCGGSRAWQPEPPVGVADELVANGPVKLLLVTTPGSPSDLRLRPWLEAVAGDRTDLTVTVVDPLFGPPPTEVPWDVIRSEHPPVLMVTTGAGVHRVAVSENPGSVCSLLEKLPDQLVGAVAEAGRGGCAVQVVGPADEGTMLRKYVASLGHPEATTDDETCLLVVTDATAADDDRIAAHLRAGRTAMVAVIGGEALPHTAEVMGGLTFGSASVAHDRLHFTIPGQTDDPRMLAMILADPRFR